ncbi:hypothetical protein F5Y13DRAFT_201498 [Hypoxylon sp. FL1857]|nr:hypothetical protein F5Y13DRAFT_201498 [Hypoxylon sp. FL1857]
MDNEGEDQPKPAAPIDAGEKEAKESTVTEKRDVVMESKQPTPSETDTQAQDLADDTANEDKLTSPPDSSSVSSVNPDMLGDEIVVGTRANGNKSPGRRAASERGDVVMADAEEDEEPVSHYPKRKRASIYNDLNDDKIDASLVKDPDETDASLTKVKPRQRFDEDNKHVPIGYWRDSPVPQDEGKHMVVGFIDVRDRLRTRIRSIDLKGEHINTRLFPVPPGPGGSWVTFERIVFLDHLVGLDHNMIKEYVRVRADTLKIRTEDADLAAVQEARRRLEANPPPETPQPPSIAWGRDLPDHAQGGRPEAKRRRYGSGVGTIAERAERAERNERTEQPEQAERIDHAERPDRTPIVPQLQPEIPQPPRKPTRILVGVWSKSSPVDNDDKHAVYGILGANDMFRVKLVRETKDGRFIDDNFPPGAGALWISYDEVIFLEHLKDLTRPEIKEYVRIRQTQIDAGETKDEKVANETKAVHEAQMRAPAIAASPGRPLIQGHATHAAPILSSNATREDIRESHELRQPRRDVASRSVEPLQASRYPHPEVEIRQASRHASTDPIERVQGYANREVARMEAVQLRTDRHQASRNAMANPAPTVNMHDTRRDFNDNLQRMNHVWRAQENMRMGPTNGNGNADVIMHGSIKYERKQNGPFKDRLVSQGTIINIDGEDYVEYRVLTKPSFF